MVPIGSVLLQLARKVDDGNSFESRVNDNKLDKIFALGQTGFDIRSQMRRGTILLLLLKQIIREKTYGHFRTQIPHPLQRTSEMDETLDCLVTSIQSLPIFTTGQFFLHSK